MSDAGPEVAPQDEPVDEPVDDAAPDLVTIDDIRAAAATLRGIALRTPLVPFGPADRNQWLKAESLQPIGAFKIRGAYIAAAALSPAERARGLITYSSGNHAQGVARAARLLGVPAAIVMPSDAPAIKRARVEADGAQVVVVGPASERAAAGGRGDRPVPGARDHPALRRRADHRRPGHGRAGDRRGPAVGGRRPRPDRRRRPGQRGRRGDPGTGARCPDHRRRARARRGRPRVAGDRPHRHLAGGAREPDDRGRDAHPVDRPPELRPSPRPARRRRRR